MTGRGEGILSRRVLEEELERNTSRIPSLGWCGYLSLEWAERRSRGVGGQGLDLRDVTQRDRLASVIAGFLHGCLNEAVCSKLQRALAHLGGTSQPERLERTSGLWLDIGDIRHMNVDFPVIVWGLAHEDGLRRVMYPVRGNLPMNPDWVEEVLRTPAQFVLDSAHFFPLDEVPDGAPAIMSRLRGVLGEELAESTGGGLRSGGPEGVVVGPPQQMVAAGGTPSVLQADLGEQLGQKRRTGVLDDWVIRKSKSPREWRVRKELEIDGMAGEVRRRAGADVGSRKQRKCSDGSWAPGADAEPPD